MCASLHIYIIQSSDINLESLRMWFMWWWDMYSVMIIL